MWVQWWQKGEKEACTWVALCKGRHLEGRKYRIQKFGCFWQIGICISDSDILQPLTLPHFWDHTPNCQCSMTPHKAVCTPINLHCWSDWIFTCCKTVENQYCPAVLLAIAIPCFALLACFQILHKSWKFCMKFGHLILRKIFKFIPTGCQILRLKCTKFNFG